jgi:hypothetical protein
MKNMMKIGLGILLSFNLCGCFDRINEQMLTIQNSSSQDILYFESVNIYPDTSISAQVGSSILKVGGASGGKSDYVGYLKNHEKFMLFIVSKQVADTTPWDKIRKDYLILKRYDLDLKTLDSLNWRIVFK